MKDQIDTLHDPVVVVGMGLTVADVLMQTKRPIVLHQKNPVSEQIIQLGGVVPTALSVLSRFGVPCAIYSVVGDDYFGRLVIDILQKEGIDHAHVEKTTHKTPLSIVIVEYGSAERTGFNARGIFPSLPAGTFSLEHAEKTRYMIIDGHNPGCAVHMLRQAKERGICIVCDLGNLKDGMEPLMQEADVVIAPQAYWRLRWPQKDVETIAKELCTVGPGMGIVTMGNKGSYIATKDGVVFQPAFFVKAVDTNGAGDIFLGSFVYGLIRNWELKKTAAFAAAIAALSCTKLGKDQKIPQSAEEGFAWIREKGWKIE